MSERPLISFILLAYRQEQFVADAVAAALAQTYQPLEIILTDDCSPDGTFRIMSEMAEAYRGPHKIILNRNPENLGICGHVNRAVGLSRGDLIILAAADDISLPERTLALYQHWQGQGGRADSVFSDAFLIDEEGCRTGRLFEKAAASFAGSVEEAVQRGGVGVPGCTHMFTRRSFDNFGPIDPKVIAEDMVLPFRSLLGGGVAFVGLPLVNYRVHGRNESIAATKIPPRARRERSANNATAVLQTWLNDLKTASATGMISKERARTLSDRIAMEHYWSIVEARCYATSLWSALAEFLRDAMKHLGRIIDRYRRSKKG